MASAGAGAFFAAAPSVWAQESQLRSAQEIDQIVGPIALYPDPLMGIVLPASTAPGDLQQAAGDPSSAENNQSLDESVRALAHYPDLLSWMNDNIDWTQQLGATFAAQPGDVISSVQRLRARAKAVGTLIDTPQQRVVVEGELIAIVPAQPTVIYVPRYDPAVVYIDNPPRRGAEVFAFSAGFALGAWLTYDFDWHRHALFIADRAAIEHRDWTRPSFAVAAVGTSTSVSSARREWHPAANRTQLTVNISKTVVQPHAMGDNSAHASRGSKESTASNTTTVNNNNMTVNNNTAQQNAATDSSTANNSNPSEASAANKTANNANPKDPKYDANRQANATKQPSTATPDAARAQQEQQRTSQANASSPSANQNQNQNASPSKRRPSNRGTLSSSTSTYDQPPASTEKRPEIDQSHSTPRPELNSPNSQNSGTPQKNNPHKDEERATPPQSNQQAQTPASASKPNTSPSSTNNKETEKAKSDDSKSKKDDEENDEDKKKKKPE